MVCNDEDVENLKAQIQAYAAKLKEYGAQAVVITCSFEQLQADGSGRGHTIRLLFLLIALLWSVREGELLRKSV